MTIRGRRGVSPLCLNWRPALRRPPAPTNPTKVTRQPRRAPLASGVPFPSEPPMKFSSLSLALALGLASTASFAAGNPAGKPELGDFGVDLSARDLSVKPGDDFNRYVSGTWLKSYQLKDYETSFGSFNALRDRSEEQVHGLIEELHAKGGIAPGSNDQKVRDFYASYM